MRGFAFCAVLGVLLLQQGKSDDAYVDYDYTVGDDYGETTVPSITPPRFLPEIGELTATVGETVTFPCQVEIPDGSAVLWKKEDTTYGQVTNISGLEGDRFRLVNGTSLQIPDVVPTDSGIYSCQIATEPAVSSSHILKVTSRPSHGRSCPHKSSKWIDLGGDYCYFIEQDTHVKWIEAVYKCFQEGGSLATIRSMEEIKRLIRHVNYPLETLYIGLWKHNDGSFEWVDKSTSDFRNWDDGEPNERSETCVELSIENGKWNDVDCSKYTGYICSSLKNQVAPVSKKVCPDTSVGWHDYGSEYCYIIELHSTTSSYIAAEHCSAEGGSLASFHSIEEISVVREHMKDHHDRLHIGFRQNSDEKFEWTDRSPVDLIFWDYGEPNDIQEQCGEIYPSTGLWNDIPCSKYIGYICSTPKVDPENAATEAPPATTAVNCGGDIIAGSGTIKTPNYPENYSPNLNCLWKITAPENFQIALTFQLLQLEYGADCEFDYVEILDGNEPGSTVLHRFCGSNAGEEVTSSGSKMSVKFSSDQVNQRLGFLAEFHTVAQCGGNIVAEEGVISSRNYPENYFPNDVCTWKITVPENNVVHLRFKALETENDGGCVNDYVEVLDGHDVSSPVLQRYCGFDIPADFRSSGHKMTVTFVSDASQEYYGFSLEFTKAKVEDLHLPLHPTAGFGGLFRPTDSTGRFGDRFRPTDSTAGFGYLFATTEIPEEYQDKCQAAIDYEKGTLVNPHYPSHYNPNEDCTWNIRAPPGLTISLRFKTFQLESSDMCNYDYVAVYDGPEVSSTSLGKFCGDSVPDLITSSGNQMSVHFKSDPTVQTRGFSATFSTSSGSMTDFGDFETEGCGENILSDEGIIQSPSYPELYGPGTKCSWKITVPRGHQVALTFTDFKVEGHVRCAYDYVLIRDGHFRRSRILSKLCGYEVPSEVRSSGNKMMIEFKSDSSGEYSGFSAEFKKDLPQAASTGIPSQEFGACGGYIHNENGTIQSPNYPLPYEPLQNCTWKITVPEDDLIFLKFHSVDLEYDPDCKFDKVTVFDGDDEESNATAQFCEFSHEQTIVSSKNKIAVKFTSDDSFAQSGFKATFAKAVRCGGNITAEKGFLQSPNGTQAYTCTWRITVPENYTVLLKVHAYPMPYNPDRYFNMEIRDGAYVYSNSLGQLFNLYDNFTVRSRTNEMFIVATSYDSEEPPHLYAEFEQYVCGGDISGDAGVFLSPNYPDQYGANEDCTWRITVPENYVMRLSFPTFQLEYSSTCSYDFVEVREGHSPSGALLGRYCGDAVSAERRSSTNKISVRFVSDSSGQYQGFAAKFEKDYSQTDDADSCNRYIEADRGNISSPNFPDYYPANSYCAWEIRVPEGNTVTLKFNRFYLETSEACKFDYVKVFDGHDILNSGLLGSFCGPSIPNTIQSRTNKITVIFASDSSVTNTGFSAEFSVDNPDTCNQYITAGRGSISSPNYPGYYPADSDCTWKLRVPEADTLILKFNAFNLEYSDTCKYDYVKIYDGHSNINSRLLGTFCGSSIPETIQSTTDKITVVFTSDTSVTGTGFSAEFFGGPTSTTESYSELEDLLRQLPNVIFEQAKQKPKPPRGKQKKKQPVMKRSLVESLQKTFKLL